VLFTDDATAAAIELYVIIVPAAIPDAENVTTFISERSYVLNI